MEKVSQNTRTYKKQTFIFFLVFIEWVSFIELLCTCHNSFIFNYMILFWNIKPLWRKQNCIYQLYISIHNPNMIEIYFINIIQFKVMVYFSIWVPFILRKTWNSMYFSQWKVIYAYLVALHKLKCIITTLRRIKPTFWYSRKVSSSSCFLLDLDFSSKDPINTM